MTPIAPPVTLWKHQQDARQFVHELWKRGARGAMLAMVMGSGKTRVTITLINDLKAQLVLILCPRRVVEVWRAQFQQYSDEHYEFAALDDRAGTVREKMMRARDMRAWALERKQRLVICINYESARMEPFASWALKVAWPLVIADECVPPGSLISTPKGNVPIESLREGDVVFGYDHAANRIVKTRVTMTFYRLTTAPFIKIRNAYLTPEHPVWTVRGYLPARLVRSTDEVLIGEQKNSSPYLQAVPEAVSGTKENYGVLQQELSGKNDDGYARSANAFSPNHAESNHATRSARKTPQAFSFQIESIPADANNQKSAHSASPARIPDAQWRQWQRPDPAAAITCAAVELAYGVGDTHPCEKSLWLAEPLQNRYRRALPANSHRGGRPNPQGHADPRKRRQERCFLTFTGLVGPTLSEPGDPGESRRSREPHPVHNLETGTGNYFVNGLLVHNCHRCKTPTGATSKFLNRVGLRSIYRLALTGTPMPHQPLDIWAQFRFLNHMILDHTYGSFKLRHAKMGGYFNKEIVGWKDLDQLYEKFKTIAYQVGEDALDLPEEMDETLSADMTPDGARIYADMEQEMVAWIKDMDGQGVEVTAANAMVRLVRLQQITGGSLPDEDNNPVVVDTGKENLLAEFLEDMGKEPVVIFAVYKADLAAIHRAAAANNLASSEISGSRDELAQWNKGSSSVLAVQIQSGGEGIDLTRARIAVYYSHGFSLAQYMQSRYRVRRPPQKRPCAFYHLHIRNSIDRYILDAVLRRQDLIESVLKGLRRN